MLDNIAINITHQMTLRNHKREGCWWWNTFLFYLRSVVNYFDGVIKQGKVFLNQLTLNMLLKENPEVLFATLYGLFLSQQCKHL